MLSLKDAREPTSDTEGPVAFAGKVKNTTSSKCAKNGSPSLNGISYLHRLLHRLGRVPGNKPLILYYGFLAHHCQTNSKGFLQDCQSLLIEENLKFLHLPQCENGKFVLKLEKNPVPTPRVLFRKYPRKGRERPFFALDFHFLAPVLQTNIGLWEPKWA